MSISFANVSDSLLNTAEVNQISAAPAMKSDLLISDEAMRIFQYVAFSVICLGIDIFGTVTNIINIICFVKQGFNDPVNISLIGLSVSDLGSVVTLIWSDIAFIPEVQDADLPFDPLDIHFLITGWLHLVFARITGWITALITLERCLCIAMPLKVKILITPNRVTIINVCVFFIHFLGLGPVYYINRLGVKFSPERNRTILGVVYAEDRAAVEPAFYGIYSGFLPFAAFFIVISCTITLVVELRSKAKWRSKCSAPNRAGNASARDQKVAKMMVMISALFIACFIPCCMTMLGMAVMPEMALGGQYMNTLYVLGAVVMVAESTNSAMNIFIYYHMSSRYRAVFRGLFINDDSALCATRRAVAGKI